MSLHSVAFRNTKYVISMYSADPICFNFSCRQQYFLSRSSILVTVAFSACSIAMATKTDIVGISEKNMLKDQTEITELKAECPRDGETLYMESKEHSTGFSQWSALSPAKRAQYERHAIQISK